MPGPPVMFVGPLGTPTVNDAGAEKGPKPPLLRARTVHCTVPPFVSPVTFTCGLGPVPGPLPVLSAHCAW